MSGLLGGGISVSGSVPAAPTSVDKSVVDFSGGSTITMQVATSTGLTGGKLVRGATTYVLTGFAIVDATHVSGVTPVSMTASATPCDVIVSNAFGDSPALAAAVEIFKPTNISGCIQWLRADLGVTVNGSSQITNWADQSGNGFDMSSTLASRPPLQPVTGPNGKLAVPCDGSRWGGAGDRLDAVTPAVLLAATSAEAFVIAKSTSSANDGTGGFWFYGAGGAGWLLFSNVDYENFGSTLRPAGTGSPSTINGVTFEYNCQANSSVMNAYINKVLACTNPSNTVGWNGTSVTILNNTLGGWSGLWCELILYNKVLSTAERARVRGYEDDRYGLSL